LEGQTNNANRPSHEDVSHGGRSTTWPGGTAMPPGSHSDCANDLSCDMSGSPSDRSTGIVVKVRDGPATSTKEGLGLDVWHQMYSSEDTNSLPMQVSAAIHCAVESLQVMPRRQRKRTAQCE